MLVDKLRKDRARASLKSRLKRVYFGLASALYLGVLFTPTIGAFAQESTAEPEVCTVPAGTDYPTGSSAWTFEYNCDSGLWENNYYTWNPNTYTTTARFQPETTFNSEKNLWEVREWMYVASEGVYRWRVTSTYAPAPEEPSSPITDSQTSQTSGTQPLNEEPDEQVKTTENDQNSSTASSLVQPSGGISVESDNDTSIDLDLSFDADIDINVDANTTTGDASVLQNTFGGDAQSGDAHSEAYILNMIQSLWGSSASLPELYTANIQGDYFGDIMIDPNLLAGNSEITLSDDIELDVDISNNVNLENNVNLSSQSGDATVSSNTNAGDATSGDATAIANIINMINSSVAANQSFLGVLNVNGNFDGDILFADNLTEQLLAANVPSTQLQINNDVDIDAQLTNNVSITDNINATATSGNAEVSNNTSAGDATSGDADTTVTVFNLIGHNVQASQALLVFVNVGGEWVGFITNAPSGSTAAAFGSGVVSHSVDTDVNVENNINITNNVNLLAATGDATVSSNTNAGDATSGNATAIASVSNMVNTSFNLQDYLWVLFLNVTGDWCGSVGTDTSCGNKPAPLNIPPPIASNTSSQDSHTLPPLPEHINPNNVRLFTVSLLNGSPSEGSEEQPIALASATEITPISESSANFASPEPANSHIGSWIFIGGIVLGYIIIFQGGRIIDIFKKS